MGGDQTLPSSNAHHIVYDGNTIYRGSGAANSVKLDDRPRRSIIRKNTIYGIQLTFYEQPDAQVVVYNNSLVQSSGYAVQLWNAETTSNWGGLAFKNNIFAFAGLMLLQHTPNLIDGSYANIKMNNNVYRFSGGGIEWAMSSGVRTYNAALSGSSGQSEFNTWRSVTGQEPSGGRRTEATLNQLFVNAAAGDFHLPVGSPAIDAGGPLTTTTSAGTGTVIPVADSFYFYDGYGLTQGDLIQVGANTNLRVMAVDDVSSRVTVDRSISWNNGDAVTLPFNGSAPDAGAFESGTGGGTRAAPSNLRIVP